MRAPEKRVFKVDVGNIPPQEVDQYMQRLMDKMKKVPYIDEKTGDYNLRFNLQNMVEDFYLPVRGGDSGTSIEPLSGMEFTGIDDIQYLRNKMLAALKIPKAFLGYEEDLSGKATLASEDIRFAKTVNRVQRILVSELTKIAIIHLYAQGYKDASLVNFSLELTNPSVIFEKEKVAIWSDKVAVSKDMIENKLFSRKWIYNNVFKISDDDVDIQKNDIVDDAKQNYRFKQIEEEGIDPAKPFNKIKPEEGGSGGGMGGTGPEGAAPEGGSPEEPPKKLAEYERPSQAGKKKASDYPFGEDVLGSLENNRKVNNTIGHKFKNDSPLSLERFDSYLKDYKSENRELLREFKSENKPSYLDESNIL